jgi:hypothetical protein
MAPSTTQKGVNANTLAGQRSRIIPIQYPGRLPYIFSPTVLNFANGKVFPSLGNSSTNPFIYR